MTNVQQIEMFEDLIEKVQNVANAIPPANAVPDVKSTDNGKVLKATYDGEGSYDWDTPDSGLPSTSGHNINEVLVIDDATLNPPTADWYSLNEVLPNMDPNHYASNGEVITYNSSTHKAEWQAPQGGGGGLPDYSQADQGSVLNKQYNGELGWDRPEDLLPEGSLLPEISGNDDGKVLQAVYSDKSGSYAHWVTPSGGGGLSTTTFTVNASDFTQNGSSYEVVFDSNGDYQGDVSSVISSRIYYSGVCSIPCSLIYVDKTGWIAQVSADDYNYINMTSGLTLKIFSVS